MKPHSVIPAKAHPVIPANAQPVIPAKAGIQGFFPRVLNALGSRLRGNDNTDALGSRLRGNDKAWLVLAVAAFLFSTPAQADVWGYVDAKGVAHFASEKVDERYELFYRGGESFDTSEGIAEKTPRPVTVPTSSAARLIAYFEVAPGYKQVKHHLKAASKAQNIDYELLQAVIATESGFDAAAVSPKGAIGLMQVMPATAQRWGVLGNAKLPVEKRLAEPATNIRTGSRHLRYLLDLYPGNVELALAAYNAGEGAVQRAGNRIPNYPETQNYVRTVLQLYSMLKPPAMKDKPRRVRVEMAGRRNLPDPADLARMPDPVDPQ